MMIIISFKWKVCPVEVEALSLLSGSFVPYIHNITYKGKVKCTFPFIKGKYE